MATNTYQALLTQTLSTAASSITFSSIPQGYTDLRLVIQTKGSTTSSASVLSMQFNLDTTSNYSVTRLLGSGTAATSDRFSNQSLIDCGYILDSQSTPWGISTIDVFNYANTTTYKTSLIRWNTTGNSNYVAAVVGLWRKTPEAINRIDLNLTNASSTFSIGSTFTIYGIQSASVGAKATGGIISSDANYFYHTFAASGNFVPTQSLSCDVLVVAGGGGGGTGHAGGGGGAGGLRTLSAFGATTTSYTITVGAGGTGGSTTNATNGTTSIFSTINTTGGGYGGGTQPSGMNGATGGSGGGGKGDYYSNGTGGTGNAGSYSPVEGYTGGLGLTANSYAYTAGGGGGAGAVGANATAGSAGNGGIGIASSINGTSTYYAGGGGGGTWGDYYGVGVLGQGAGGNGGGGSGVRGGAGTAGTVNLGGGGGGGGMQLGGTANLNGGAGGSGIVIIRYPK